MQDRPPPRFLIVGVGASAGGIEALRLFFRDLPPSPEMAFVVVTHLSPDHKSLLAEIVQRFTALPVRVVADGIILRPGTVYVAPERMALRLAGGRIISEEISKSSLRVKTIDHFFTSLAEQQGEYAAGVVLSGLDGDGTMGIKAIKERDGLTLAQTASGASPKYPSMPESAIATGLVDLALPAEEMAGRLVEFVRGMDALKDLSADGASPRAQDVLQHKTDIAAAIHDHLGHDFSGYKDETFTRRVRRRMVFLGLREIGEYVAKLRTDPAETTALFRDLLISVTDFFRDADAFKVLADEVIPAIVKGRDGKSTVRVWVPGCATGEEVFSIAILIREATDKLPNPPQVQIFATDIDERALEIARTGRYPALLLKNVSEDRLRRFFSRDESSYVISRDIRELCVFSPHSVFRDPPFSRVDLVSCRNLLIYLGADMQQQVLPIFHYALRASGFLFLGLSESISHHLDLFEPVDRKNRIFKARGKMQPMPTLPFDLVKRTAFPAGTDKRTSIRHDVEAQLLGRHAPQYVVVNLDGDAIFFSSDTGRYLQPAAGVPSRQLADITRAGIRLEMRGALREAYETRQPVFRQSLALPDGEENIRLFSLQIETLDSNATDGLLLLVLFKDHDTLGKVSTIRHASADGADELSSLELDLRDTRDRLQASIEEYETALEELRSSNEELVSLNEEHQSTNEELEASREEMQSLNEELQTVNGELKLNILELDAVNDDLRHFFESSQVATVFLDSNMTIRNYTPAAADLFRVKASDRGRPLTDLSMRLVFPDLGTVLKAVLTSGEAFKADVKASDGNTTFRIAISCYDKLRGDADGLIVTATDITEFVRPNSS